MAAVRGKRLVVTLEKAHGTCTAPCTATLLANEKGAPQDCLSLKCRICAAEYGRGDEAKSFQRPLSGFLKA